MPGGALNLIIKSINLLGNVVSVGTREQTNWANFVDDRRIRQNTKIDRARRSSRPQGPRSFTVRPHDGSIGLGSKNERNWARFGMDAVGVVWMWSDTNPFL